jgi:hypothetical protein
MNPSSKELEPAVQFLTQQIPPETLADVRMLMQNKQTPWHLASHFGLGLRVRNSLREAGFKFGDIWLDDHWFEMVEEAAVRANTTTMHRR